MTPGQAFLLVLFLLYLSDCFLLVPRRGFAFLSISGRRRRWRTQLASSALGNDRGGLVFAMPLPPLGRALMAGFWPISLTRDGFTALATSCVNPGARPAMQSGFVRWGDLKTVGWEGRKLLVNGKPFLKLPSAEIARQYTKLLLRLAQLPGGERDAAIKKWCQHHLSSKRVRRRIRVFERATSGLRSSCNVLFVVTFLVVPLTYWKLGASLPFFVSLGTVALLTLMIGSEFLCLHRGLYPEQKAERFQLWLLVGVMPHYAMRAVDELSKSFLGCAHPLAVAEAVLDDRRFQIFRDAILRDLEFPAPQILHGDDVSEVLASEAGFRNQFEKPVIEAIAERRSAQPVQLLPAADDLEIESVKYCPRCLMPYEESATDCIDCGGVATVALPPQAP